MARHPKPARNRPAATPQKGLQQALQQALAAFQQGRPEECVRMCEAVLLKQATNPVALHLLGAARHRTGDVWGAVQALTEAARLDPKNAEVLANLGVALRAAGDPAAAVEALSRSVALRPNAVPAQYNLGNALGQLGRHEEAVTAYRNAVTLDPTYAPAYNNLGLALDAVGRRDEALASWRRSVAAQPTQRDAHLNLGRALLAANNAGEALPHLEAAARAAPDDADVHNEHGVALIEFGRFDDAVATLRAAVARQPDHWAAHMHLGVALCLAGHCDQGLAEFDAILARSPDDADILSNLGAALGVAADPARGRQALERALALDPDHADALNNMAELLKTEGRFTDALACYDRAVTAAPGHLTAQYGRATLNLMLGRFGEGWRNYLARPSAVVLGGHDRTALPASLAGAHVLVETDQGLGDEIFFLRFVPALKARGARVTYRPDPRLAAMLKRSGPADRVLQHGETADAADFRLSVGDLPHLLGVDDATPLPPSISLSPLEARTAALRDRLAAFGPPPYIGITWRAGTPSRRRALFKETPATALAAALRPVGATWVALQRAPLDGEVAALSAALGAPLHDLTALNTDLEAMLALVGLLDDYVCVSNTNVHLAAAQGRPCRILVPHPPEFRWMASGDESPWFPGMRVYRQQADGDWTAAFDAVGRDLTTAFPAR